MFGIALATLESIFDEVSTSAGKRAVQKREESLYVSIFVTSCVGLIVFSIVGYVLHLPFYFSSASFPLLSLRIVLEILLSYISTQAVIIANRSIFSMGRVLTIPFVMLIDSILGVAISLPAYLLMIFVVVLFVWTLRHEKGIPRGRPLIIFMSALAAVTISLYKYDTTHYNSVFAEQSIVLAALGLWAFAISALHRENPFRAFRRPHVIVQSTLYGLSSITGSYVYLFGAASVVTTVRRSMSVFSGLASDVLYFKKKVPFHKIAIAVLLVVSSMLLLGLS